ncbi:MAG TPA: hypothetical protein VIV61_17335 [Candidatus Ozemobacteraceae bacterium]
MPSPYARTLVADARTGVWASFMREQGLDTWGIGRIQPGPALFFAIGDFHAKRVFALAPVASGVAVATDDGLRLVTGDGAIDMIAVGFPLTHLAGGPDGSLLAAGIDEDGAMNLLRWRPGRRPDRWRRAPGARRRFKDLLGLFARPDGTAVLVTAGEILVLARNALQPVKLRGTPLASPDSARSSERKVPPVWIYDAAMMPDGAIALTGFARNLVRWSGGRFDMIARGHFQSLLVCPRSGSLWATDFDGNLWKDGKSGFGRVFAFPEGRIHTIWPGASGSIWLECAPNSGPHLLVPVPADAPVDAPENLWRAWVHEGVSLDLRPGLLSPGILSAVPLFDGSLCLATNAGIWTIREAPDPSRLGEKR